MSLGPGLALPCIRSSHTFPTPRSPRRQRIRHAVQRRPQPAMSHRCISSGLRPLRAMLPARLPSHVNAVPPRGEMQPGPSISRVHPCSVTQGRHSTSSTPPRHVVPVIFFHQDPVWPAGKPHPSSSIPAHRSAQLLHGARATLASGPWLAIVSTKRGRHLQPLRTLAPSSQLPARAPSRLRSGYPCLILIGT